MGLKGWIIQFLIAIDQLLNTICLGYADETLSARSWRCREKRRWRYTQAVIDRFFMSFSGRKTIVTTHIYQK